MHRMADPSKNDLIRGLSATDVTLITVGSVVGTGAFLTTADVARALPHAGLVLLAWVCGGIVAIAGALTYAELGTMMPRRAAPTISSRKPTDRSSASSRAGSTSW